MKPLWYGSMHLCKSVDEHDTGHINQILELLFWMVMDWTGNWKYEQILYNDQRVASLKWQVPKKFRLNSRKEHHQKYLMRNFYFYVSTWEGSTAMCCLCNVWSWSLSKIQNLLCYSVIFSRNLMNTPYPQTTHCCRSYSS